MKKNIKHLVIIVSVLLFSCSQNNQSKIEKVMTKKGYNLVGEGPVSSLTSYSYLSFKNKKEESIQIIFKEFKNSEEALSEESIKNNIKINDTYGHPSIAKMWSSTVGKHVLFVSATEKFHPNISQTELEKIGLELTKTYE